MNRFELAARQVTALLDSRGAGHALVGGFAVSARAEPRFTRDLDLVVAVADDAAAEAIVRAMLEHGYTMVATVEQDVTGRLATVRLRVPDGDDVIDLLFASSGIEAEIVRDSDVLEVLAGVELPVATIGHLIAMKLLARDDASRPQDGGDLRALVGVATVEDLQAAAQAVALIETRGYHRGRDLGRALRELTR